MKFSIGDTILIKKTGEEGRIAGYINNKIVEVEIGGNRLPVYVDEVDFPYLKWFTDQRKEAKLQATSKAKMPEAVNKEEGAYLSFFPVFTFDGLEDIVDKLEVTFLNSTDCPLKVQYECKTGKAVLYAETIVIPPFEKHYLHDIAFNIMNEQPRFSSVLVPVTGEKQIAGFESTLRIKPKHLFDHLSKFPKKEMPPFLLKIRDDIPMVVTPKKATKLKPATALPSTPLNAGNKRPRMVPEIDLHFEKLAPHAMGLSNFEILTLQLNALEEALSQAIQAHQRSMIVIHGVGKGKLKEEIHAILRSYPEINFFQHEWSPRYGYGATEIFFN